MGTHKYKHFNSTSKRMSLLRLVVCTIVGLPTLLGIILTPSTGIHWGTKVFFKVVFPIGLGNCYLFCCSKYVALKFGLMNERVTDEDKTSERSKSD